LQVEQFFMRDFAEEHSLLHELSHRIGRAAGACHLQWQIVRLAVDRKSLHNDALHRGAEAHGATLICCIPRARCGSLRLGSVRLVELERHVIDAPRLGWHRENDVAPALIPQYYFDYLRGGPADPLAGVVRHNQMDLRGLAALFGKSTPSLQATIAIPKTSTAWIYLGSRSFCNGAETPIGPIPRAPRLWRWACQRNSARRRAAILR